MDTEQDSPFCFSEILQPNNPKNQSEDSRISEMGFVSYAAKLLTD